MKKKLVEVSTLKSYICEANSRIYVDTTMILTPGAKDELSKRKIAIIRDTVPEFASCGAASCPARLCADGVEMTNDTPDMKSTQSSDDADIERLFFGVAAMVKEEFGIEDHQQLKDISCKIVKALKETL